MFSHFLKFRTRHQPYMVRLGYRYEMRAALTFPLASSLAEGAFTGVVAAKYFGASQLLIAVISAAPMFGNIMALVWSELSAGRPKVRFVNALQAGVVVSIGAAGLTALIESNVVGGWTFAALIIIARLLSSGIITLRSVIWRSNYPRHLRGQIIGRITIVSTAVLALATLVGSSWLDKNPRAFIYLYPGAAVLGAIGIWQFSHVRVRMERRSLRGHSKFDVARRGIGRFLAESSAILKGDKAFRDYQRWQFLSGVSFMMFGPSLLCMVSQEMTDRKTQYLLATMVLQIVPMVVSLVTLPVWTPLFDRMHVTRFRVIQTSVSVVAQLTLFVGAMVGLHCGNGPGVTPALLVIGVGQVLVGFSLAGGNLAWTLGHNDFAPAEKSGQYMAVHVMLTGLRGCTAPFVGVWLYEVPWIGRKIFLLTTLICATALWGFWRMSREVKGVEGSEVAMEGGAVEH